MSYHQRDVVWVRFPSTKRRPALVLSNETVNQTGDLILLQITSKNHEDNLTHPLDSSDYEEGELSIKSYLGIHKIFILNEELIIDKVTRVSSDAFKIIIDKVVKLFS